jgi:hypothetical protein
MVRVKLIVTLSTVLVALLIAVWISHRRQDSSGIAGLSVTGQLVAYEATRHDLILRTETGERHFIVRDETPVHEGARALSFGDLTSAARCRVKVWYRDPDGQPVAREIRISCESIAPPVRH